MLSSSEKKAIADKLADLRAWRALERQHAGAPADAVITYNACGDPYGCGCGSITLRGVRAEIAKLKTELAAMPHLPNKAERKQQRRARAKEQRTR